MMRILYVVYWGALEQLGQSLVIPAVVKLASMGAEVTLVTFEKRSDLEREPEMKRVKELLEECEVEWIPLEYHKTPKLPATVFDIAHGVVKGLTRRLKTRYDIVHGRTFLGGLIGVSLAPLIGAKFVFHNEGFYPDEQVDGGFWEKDSRIHRVAKRLEMMMYSRADGIIALSNRAKYEIEAYSAVLKKRTPVIFVPSCVDLDHFKFLKDKTGDSSREIKLVYIGSVGGRYILDDIGRFVAVARKNGENVSLKIYNKADQGLAKELMKQSGLSEKYWSIDAVPYLEMPDRLAQYDAGLFFLTQGISEHGCSPTKIGEYWAVGLPVITTPNVSDTDSIINSQRAGVVVEDHTEKGYEKAFQDLKLLLLDTELAARCRESAKTHYGLDAACERQVNLYQKLVG